MSDTTPAEAEATAETVEFEFFDRTWTVTSKVKFSHHVRLRRDPTNIGIAMTFLDDEQLAALMKIEPEPEDLDAFTDAIVAAQGLGDSGNS